MNDLVLIAFTILLPLTPAYILYKALPAKTKVSGPFKGLNIQLSGAFAGYFLLVLVIMGFIRTIPAPPPDPTHEVWKVTGKMNFDKPWNDTGQDKPRLSLLPENQQIASTGDFEIQVTPEICGNGRLKFPKLLIARDGYQTVTIDLDNPKSPYGQISDNVSVSRDLHAKDLQVTPIDFRRDIPYDSAQAQIPKQPPTGGTP